MALLTAEVWALQPMELLCALIKTAYNGNQCNAMLALIRKLLSVKHHILLKQLYEIIPKLPENLKFILTKKSDLSQTTYS